LAEGENLHPANYRGCRHAKEEVQKKKSQRTLRTTYKGRMLSSNFTTPGVYFTVGLRGRTEEQQQPETHQVAVEGPSTMEPRVPEALPQHEKQTTGQSVRAANVKSLPLDKMLNVAVMVVQLTITEFNGAVLEKAKIVAITKIVLNLMAQNGH
jgi:hypothetical protein